MEVLGLDCRLFGVFQLGLVSGVGVLFGCFGVYGVPHELLYGFPRGAAHIRYSPVLDLWCGVKSIS